MTTERTKFCPACGKKFTQTFESTDRPRRCCPDCDETWDVAPEILIKIDPEETVERHIKATERSMYESKKREAEVLDSIEKTGNTIYSFPRSCRLSGEEWPGHGNTDLINAGRKRT